jgi:hypothetical protein
MGSWPTVRLIGSTPIVLRHGFLNKKIYPNTVVEVSVFAAMLAQRMRDKDGKQLFKVRGIGHECKNRGIVRTYATPITKRG